MKKYRYLAVLCAVAFSVLSTPVRADAVNVAVASNFINPAKLLASRFSDATGHTVNLSSGSTGKLYTQIINGAPFDIFLAANVSEPQRLEQQGQAVAGTRFTYAIGQLALWSAESSRVGQDCAETLRQNDYTKLAIANPRVAPYGKEAVNVLQALELYQSVQSKLIMAESIGQAFRFVSSRNVELGIISLSQIKDPRNPFAGSYCIVADTLHQPLLQQLVLLKRAETSKVAADFITFLKSAAARDLIQSYGYSVLPQ